jgi:hypothetical protein
VQFRIADRCFLNEISILKPDISILHRTPLLNCPLQSKGPGMEWVKGMEKGEWMKGMDSALLTARAAPCVRVLPPFVDALPAAL